MNENRLRAQVTLLEDYDALLRMLTGTRADPSPNKLRVYLVRGHAGLRQVANVPASVGGFYAAGTEGVAAFADISLDGDYVTSTELMFHEYAHHFMMQYHSEAAYPPWYVEGFAEYMMTARFTPRHVEVGRPNPGRATWLASRYGWLSMEQVLFDSDRLGRGDVGRFYAQSWLVAHYLLSEPARTEQLRTYLRALNAGQAPRAAFSAAFGIEPAELQRRVMTYTYRGMFFSRMDRASVSRAPEVAVTRLPASADDLLLAEAAMSVGSVRGEEILRRIRREAGKHADDPYARRVLATAEALHGDGAAADRLLEPLLAASPNDAGLLYLRGMRHLVAGRRDRARRDREYRAARVWFGRAHSADENHWQTLFRYAESMSIERNFVSENNNNVLLLAHQLAPQVGEIRMAAAAMLMVRGQHQDAIALLTPLASTAHEGPQTEAARALLAKARAGDRSVPIGFEDPPAAE
jgi:Flp pilus assembly protein TadD